MASDAVRELIEAVGRLKDLANEMADLTRQGPDYQCDLRAYVGAERKVFIAHDAVETEAAQAPDVEAYKRLLSDVVTVRDEARDAQRLLIPAADPRGDARMAYGVIADRLDAALARPRESAPPADPTVFGIRVHVVPDFPDGGALMTDGKNAVALIDRAAPPAAPEERK